MTDLFLVRHGETVWHAENRYAGVSEVELSPLGLAQAARLATWASSARLSGGLVLPAGPGGRHRDSVRRRRACDARSMPGLRELDFGAGEGLTSRQMRERFPAAFAAFSTDPSPIICPAARIPWRPRRASSPACTTSPTPSQTAGSSSWRTHRDPAGVVPPARTAAGDYRQLVPDPRQLRPDRGPDGRFRERAVAHGSFDVELIDLAQVNLPLFDEPKHPRLHEYVHQHTIAGA
jgi:hypothetical protein